MKNYLFVFTALLLALSASAETIHIPDDFDTIQEGIDTAEDGDTVLVQPGVYVENIDFTGKNITVASMFIIDGDEGHIEGTVIDGNQAGSVVRIMDRVTDDARLCGFTIQNGSGTSYGFGNFFGGGIFILQSDVVIDHCRICNNQVNDEFGEPYGGGITCYGWIEDTQPTIRDCEIFFNVSEGSGGGVSVVAGSNPTFERVVIRNNTAVSGGGIDISGECNTTMRRCAIFSNQAENFGGGISASIAVVLDLQNLTIVENSAGINGGSLWCNHRVQITAVNSISRENEPDVIFLAAGNDPSTIALSFCDIAGGINGIIANDDDEVTWGEGNIDVDPLFVDPGNGDFHLTADSPCIDAGDPEAPPDPDGTRADMGAFFYHQRDIEIEPESLEFGYVQPGTVDTASVIIRNIGLTPLQVTAQTIQPEQYPFTVNPEGEVAIEPESEHVALVIFSPEVEAQYEAVFRIESDDPDEEVVVIPIDGTSLGVREDASIQPGEFTISCVYPNPFNSRVHLRFSTVQQASVQLTIYDLTGREIVRLVDGNLEAGWHSAVWNAQSMPNGMYIARLSTPNANRNVKVTLIK